MNTILNRAKEMISNGYSCGQLIPEKTWEDNMKEGCYSDIYEAAEILSNEYNISVIKALKILKKAFEEYEPLYEQKNKLNIMRKRINESQLNKIVKESVKKVLRESDYHHAYKSGKNLDVLHCPDGAYCDEDIFICLDELKKKLRQAEERAKIPNYGNEGNSRNYLVGAIRGLQAFIDSRY